MPAPAPFRLNRSGVMLALVSMAFAGQAGAAAGRTEFTIGPVTVAGRDGVERPLTRGTELDNGDVVRTNDGRAQIRFTDGAYVSLQPNTEFGIREYLFENKTDGSEKGFFGLVKGAMRTVTGLIGRVNRNRYQITTPTATVGIRGTGGVIQVLNDGSTLVIGTSGVWSLTNPAGSIDVPAGVSGLSPSDPSTPPSDTTQQPSSGPAPLPPEQPQFTQGEERNPEGVVLLPVEPTVKPLVSGPGYMAVFAYGFSSFPNLDASDAVDATFDASGQLTSANGPAFAGEFNIGTGSHADFGTDGILAWGRWIGAVFVGNDGSLQQTYNNNQGAHYVIGMPTLLLPTTGSGTFVLAGATRPTYIDGRDSAGTFTGSMTVTFGATPTIGANFNVAMPDKTYDLTLSPIAMRSASSLFSFSPTVTVGGQACGASGCSSFVQGFFAGPSAERIGVEYHIQDFNTFRDVLGSAAFQKQ